MPEVLVTDNGPCFVSEEFELFLSANGIKHITSAPYHPATNGLAERAVQTVKKGLKKEKEGTMEARLAKVLLMYRPAELILGRRIRTRLDLIRPKFGEKVEHQQLRQKLSHDKRAREREFKKGDLVYSRNFGTGQQWYPGFIHEVTGPVSYLVKLQDGRLVKRHQDHVRRCQTHATPVEEDREEIQLESPPMSANLSETEVSEITPEACAYATSAVDTAIPGTGDTANEPSKTTSVTTPVVANVPNSPGNRKTYPGGLVVLQIAIRTNWN